MTTSYHLTPNQNGHHTTKTTPRSNSFMKPFGRNSLQNGNLEPNVRRLNQYPSSTSLQNEIANSNHVSPVSSPQPCNSFRANIAPSHTKTSPAVSRMNSSSNLKNMKRWSASQEIRMSSLENSK